MRAFFSKINWAGVVEHFFKTLVAMMVTVVGAVLCRRAQPAA